ncbi:hypothetical protein NJC40_00065 [Pseudomonas sp. 21LCFQ02]|uniref:hypothetical protein n=1 Tax=Pseudomonas sp. 21LCFQ02 TaxID=2957505 RepID=UPI00209A9857|nr:hypothetical protein [Pseudomonas sp. 21LCFQ02]MCO8166177.1 hypothetical protein [Pseudomonas sp. 21LCFQ02]
MIPESLRLKADALLMRIEELDLRLRFDALLFSIFDRADYYRFLADMIEGTQGAKPLIRIFQDDAVRFAGVARGRLSARWARQFARGGNLSRTFDQTLPAADIAVIATAQEQGDEDALQQSLRELAANTELQRKALSIVLGTMLASLFSLAALLAMILCTPGFMVPRLQSAFSLVPPENWPLIAARLFHFADVIDASWLLIVTLTVVVVSFCVWSLSNLTGPVRLLFDRYGLIWSMYRDFQSIRTLSSLATALNQKTAAKGLREGLAMQIPGASRWKRYHLEQMLAYVDSGTDNSLIFTTGTLDRDTAWYLQDLIDSRGLEGALSAVKSRLETRVLKKLSLQSLVLSWVLILSVLAAATGLMLWIYAAIDALSSALQNQFY